MQFSPYQTAIFDEITTGIGNIFVEAVAGSGKTTTIVEATTRLPLTATRIFLAFNKSIAEELKSRGVNASTFHALALNSIRPLLPTSFRIDSNKVSRIFRSIVARDLQNDFADLPRVVSVGKAYGIGIFDDIPNTPDAWQNVLDAHDFSFPDNSEHKVCEFAIRILRMSNEDRGTIDFDDMLYFNIMLNAPMRTFDFVFVDEAQDTSGIQLAIIDKIANTTTRYIFVGDRHQAIYGFRGAGIAAVPSIIARYHCTTLPLSISYRCAAAIVAEAQAIVPQIQAASDAPSGVIHLTRTSAQILIDIDQETSNCAVLCRNTKPLIKLAYFLINHNIPVQLLGRDLGTGLKRLMTKVSAFKTLTTLATLLQEACDREVSEELAHNRTAKAAFIEDRYNTLLSIIDNITSDPQTHDTTKTAVTGAIDALFRDNANACKLATIHKAKGLEWNHVFFLDPQLIPSKYASRDWELQQEENLRYVAITRAKHTLTYITSTTTLEN